MEASSIGPHALPRDERQAAHCGNREEKHEPMPSRESCGANSQGSLDRYSEVAVPDDFESRPQPRRVGHSASEPKLSHAQRMVHSRHVQDMRGNVDYAEWSREVDQQSTTLAPWRRRDCAGFHFDVLCGPMRPHLPAAASTPIRLNAPFTAVVRCG